MTDGPEPFLLGRDYLICLKHLAQAVEHAPNDERKVRAVPQSGEEEYDKLVRRCSDLSLSVAAEGNIDVLLEPGGEGYMPAPPKFLDARRDKRIVEVLSEIKAEHAAETDGHIAVAGKIKEYLKRICNGSDPRRSGAELIRREAEDLIGQKAHLIRNKHLFCKAEDKAAKSAGYTLQRELALSQPVGDIGIAHYRAGDKLREEGDVQKHREQALLHVLLITVYVDNIAEPLEGEEGYSDWQPYLRNRNGKSGYSVKNLNEKAGIFICDQKADIEDYGEKDRKLIPFFARRAEAEQVVQYDRYYHDHNRHRLAEGVENQARCGKYHISRAGVADNGVENKRRRQEHKQKCN